LDYLVWQLEAFKRAGRRSHRNLSSEDLQRKLRELRKEMKWSPIKDRVKKVADHFTEGLVAKRLGALPDGARFGLQWQKLGDRVIDLSAQRDEVVHSAVAWSGAVVRTVGGGLDGKTLPLDLARDEQLASDLGQLSTELAQFATEVGFSLPFASDDKIINAPTLTIDLGDLPKPEPAKS
jgi:hypothetical protein